MLPHKAPACPGNGDVAVMKNCTARARSTSMANADWILAPKRPRYFPAPVTLTCASTSCTKSCMSPSPLPTPTTVKKPSSKTFAASSNMTPIKFPEQTAVLAKDQPEYLPLPVYIGQDEIISCWRLSLGERLKLLFTGRLWLRIMTFGERLQPQQPGVDCPFERKR